MDGYSFNFVFLLLANAYLKNPFSRETQLNLASYYTPIMDEGSKVGIVKVLLDSEADCNVSSALYFAATGNKPQICEHLLKLGAPFSKQDFLGVLPLML